MITITFGDVAENHVGMQKIGAEAKSGFSKLDLITFQDWFESQGHVCELVTLSDLPEIETDEACILLVKQGVNAFTDSDDLFNHLEHLNWDKKAKMRGRVVNKRARWNLVFDDEPQEPDYEDSKGRIISWTEVPELLNIKSKLATISDVASDLYAEGNYYYDPSKCGIGYHGDAERKKVIAIRLYQDTDMIKPIYYQWYHQSEPVGPRIEVPIAHGDLYIMSQKAVGTDWKRRLVPTLRHATGADKYTTVKRPVLIDVPIDDDRYQELVCLTVVKLKDILRNKGLKVSGRKAELVNRILAN